jgi:5-deoxy-glucuronate isomerase
MPARRRFDIGTLRAVIDVAGATVTTLLDSGDGRLGCARSTGHLAVRCRSSFAWLVIERGRGRAMLDGELLQIDGRDDVFGRPGWSVLLAPGAQIEVDGDLSTTVVWRRADDFETPTRVVDAASVVEESRGEGVTRRRVRTYLNEGPLIVGETINPPGGWSSWPPHSHDHEELYLYRFEPRHGFGVHIDLAESPVTVRDGDVVRIRSGEHPVVAAPGCTMYYLWALAGSTPTVNPRVSSDFAF